MREPAAESASPAKKVKRKETWRETIESLNGALILAILIRGFTAEAFVIPTGSMAPTLMGRHKDVTCPECGNHYTVNASERSDMVEGAATFGLTGPSSGRDGPLYSTCANCRFPARIADEPSHNGDRILVMKAPYELPSLPGGGPPKRWEVIVFHYPEKPEVNYIKRLIGLSGEEIRIHTGDILTRTSPGDPFRLAPKPWKHLSAMRQLVYDDSLRPKSLTGLPEWKRWAPDREGSWSEEESGTYRAKPGGGGTLAYRHLVPDPDQWEAIADKKGLPRPPRATLITDFASYNTGQPNTYGRDDSDWYQVHWVGDLTLSARVEDQQAGAGGTLTFELVRAGVVYRCRIDLAGPNWKATLTAGETQIAQGDLGSGSWHDLAFLNVDGRLNLIADGSPVFGDEGIAYREEDAEVQGPSAEDLRPARIVAEGADASVSRLALHRDLYYTQRPGYQASDYDENWEQKPRTPSELSDFLSDPAGFGVMAKTPSSEYRLEKGRYMMLGDNSPRSSDSRAWRDSDRAWARESRRPWEVPEQFLVGKAFFIYWPHGVPFGPSVSVYFRGNEVKVPFRPNVERMTLIR